MWAAVGEEDCLGTLNTFLEKYIDIKGIEGNELIY